MILTGFFDDALPGRAEAPWKVFAMEGNGRRGREVGKEGPLAVIRGGRGRAFDARGDETCGRTEAGLREEGAADIVMTAIAGQSKARAVNLYARITGSVQVLTHSGTDATERTGRE